MESIHKEGRIELALNALRTGQLKSVREAQRLYDVPRTTLRDRIDGRVARIDSRANSHKLTSTEELVLMQQILEKDQRGAPATVAIIRQMANILLAERVKGTSQMPVVVGKNWASNFVRRTPEIDSKYNRKYDYQRAKCEDPKLISEWFERIRSTIEKYGIATEDIYNFDESGFMMGIISIAKVITSAEKARRAFFT